MPSTHPLRPLLKATLLSVGLAITAAVATAHDFWIIPTVFMVMGNASMEIRGHTSSKFPISLSAVTPERVAEARVIGANDDVAMKDVTVAGKSLLLKQRPGTAGQRVVTVALVTRTTKTLPAGLKRYIALEGAPELAQRYDAEGAFVGADSLEQRTTKYAKTFVEVGMGGPRAFTKVAGHALEFVPTSDPSMVKTGRTLTVKVLFRGTPLAGAYLHAGWAPEAALADSAALPAGVKDQHVVTNNDGEATIKIDHDGLWNVRTLHAAPATGGARGWEVAFATVVFRTEVPGGHKHEANGVVDLPREQPSADSAAALAAVTKFHTALAAGDSAGALAMLSNDVMILESGGVETREEYRSHHLPGDMAFARAIKSDRVVRRVTVRGDVAWVTGTSTTTGDYRGRAVNSAGAELVVLVRTPEGWRISAVHWSSRARRAAGN